MKYFEYNTRFEELRSLVPVPESERHSLQITDIVAGSFLKIDGVLFKVVDKFFYKYKKDRWTEYKLMSLVDESIRYIEVEVDDDIEIFMSDEEVKLNALGLNRDDLAEIWEEDDFSNIQYNGRIFEYEDCFKAKFRRSENADWEHCVMYEFESEIGKKQFITIEDWDGEIQVFISSKLSKGRVEIVSI